MADPKAVRDPVERETLRRVSLRVLAYLICYTAADWLAAPSAAAGLAMTNAVGTGRGFFCQIMMGNINQATHSYPLALLPIVGFALLGSLILLRPQHARMTAAAA